MTNGWIIHVKSFASKHHLKYGDALKHPQCKATYHKGGSIYGAGPKPVPPVFPKRYYTCALCENRKQVDDDRKLYPRKCGNENINPHQICPECWFHEEHGFALEDARHKCPGCLKGMPFVNTGPTKEEIRARNREQPPPNPSDILLVDSSSDDDNEPPPPQQPRKKRRTK